MKRVSGHRDLDGCGSTHRRSSAAWWLVKRLSFKAIFTADRRFTHTVGRLKTGSANKKVSSMRVKSIVSLGANCRSAANLHRFFGRSQSFPFDWWITPNYGLETFLKFPDIDRLYDENYLELALGGSGPTVRNTAFFIELHHEFPRISHHENAAIVDDWRKAIPAAKAATTRRWERLCKLAGPILFVRDCAWEPEAPMAETAGLIQQRFPNSRLLIINGSQELEGSLSLTIDDSTTEDWRGDPVAWDAALSTLDIQLL